LTGGNIVVEIKSTNRLELVNDLCKLVGIDRIDPTNQYLSRDELIIILTWITLKKESDNA